MLCLKVFFLSCHFVRINQNLKILLSYWSKFKFWLIFTCWHNEKKILETCHFFSTKYILTYLLLPFVLILWCVSYDPHCFYCDFIIYKIVTAFFNLLTVVPKPWQWGDASDFYFKLVDSLIQKTRTKKHRKKWISLTWKFHPVFNS